MQTRILTLAVAAAALSGCAMWDGLAGSSAIATAQLRPTAGNTASGTIQFRESGGRVRITGEVRGLKPMAEHGFHVHEKGDCSAPDGMSTGGHFNPDGRPHGQHGTGAHHVGDLPSLRADAQGVARIDAESTTLRVGSGAADIIGKGLIVHRDPDDYRTQPTGNSGARIACAVIARS
jgi:Cu-Zn family superoxide dismutase